MSIWINGPLEVVVFNANVIGKQRSDLSKQL
jgi:hypothetical protein